MKCKNCGKEISNESLTCPSCGENPKISKISSQEDDNVIIKNNSFQDDSMGIKEKGLVFIFIVLGLIGFSLLFNFFLG